MGTNYYLVKNRPSVDEGLHIGKSSFGCRFLFHKYPPLNTFELWKEHLEETTSNGTHVIMNEYDEIVSYEDFIHMVEEKQRQWKVDMFESCEDINGYRFLNEEFS